MSAAFESIQAALAEGNIIPFVGAGALSVAPTPVAVPESPEALAAFLTDRVTVPHKIRKNLTAAAQFIENFKHRKTLVKFMNEAYRPGALPGPVHEMVAGIEKLPVVVNLWYDDAMQRALSEKRSWGMVQGVSRSEYLDQWVRYYNPDGTDAPESDARNWETILYQPWGSVGPMNNYLASDSDFVEVLTEIDIQTPIPPVIQERRKGRHFLFLGCRFNTQIDRNFARQIMKRSSDLHWAVLPEKPTRMEARFIDEQNIVRLDCSLEEFLAGCSAGETVAA